VSRAPEHHTRPHPISLMLRVLPQHGLVGHIVGRAEVVDTGEVIAISDEQDLVELIQRLSAT
jgi:hypothetical protein